MNFQAFEEMHHFKAIAGILKSGRVQLNLILSY